MYGECTATASSDLLLSITELAIHPSNKFYISEQDKSNKQVTESVSYISSAMYQKHQEW